MAHAVRFTHQVEPDSLSDADRADGLVSIDHAAEAMKLPAGVVKRALEKGAFRGVSAPEARVSAQSVEAFLAARVAVDRTASPPEAA
ncbi:MAG: hypothetical protein OEM67_00605 [Thermoleophilia bacterium]|nr:hypothetical protein [Thermoleophilia bacterium]MDH3725700.1 hypothetical protein [Thermoleophilia bacterium]